MLRGLIESKHNIQELGHKLPLALLPINAERLPKRAAYALVDQIVVVYIPKGQFKDCGKRIQSRMSIIQCRLTTVFAMCVCISTSFEFGLIYCMWHILSDCKFKC
jgi:hypothetical protein